MAGETILIIDDNADVRNLLGERVLPSYGYRTLTAPDGQEGLWQIRTHNPDLILLDLRLPDMTGIDLLHILSSEGYDTPVILITAYGSELIAAQALRLGVHDYIIKPFTLDEIIESVERALTEQRLRHERNALTNRLRCCTTALRLLADAGAEIALQQDPDLQLCRLLEVTVAALRARSGRLWVRGPQGDFYLRAAQGYGEERAYILRQREESPQVEQALATGTLQEWTGKTDGVTERCLAKPILQGGRPVAVLEIHWSPPESGPDELGNLVLDISAEWIGLAMEWASLRLQAATLKQQFQALGTLSRDAFLVLDAQDKIVAVTPAVEQITGQPPAEVIGKGFREWVQEIESPQEKLADWCLWLSGEERTSERYAFFFRGRQGDTRQAEVQVMLQQDSEGTPWRYLLFHEVTSYNRLEQEVRSLRQTLGEVVRGSRLGLSLTDLQGTILAINTVLADWLQSSPEALVGRPLWEAFSRAEGYHVLPEEIARAHREGQGYAEVGLPTEGESRLGIAPLLLVGSGGVPQAMVVLAGPIPMAAGSGLY